MMQTFSSVTCSPQLRLYLKIVAAVDGPDAETGSEEEELKFARKKDVHVERWVWRDGRRDPERSEG